MRTELKVRPARNPNLDAAMQDVKSPLSRNCSVERKFRPHPFPLPRGEGDRFSSLQPPYHSASSSNVEAVRPLSWGRGLGRGRDNSPTAWFQLRPLLTS